MMTGLAIIRATGNTWQAGPIDVMAATQQRRIRRKEVRIKNKKHKSAL
jgi:hypothetical protein